MGEDRVPNATTSDQLHALTPVPTPLVLNLPEHFVQFYEDDVSLIEAVTRYLGQGLYAGDACIVIGTASHRQELETRLLGHGLDVAHDTLRDRYFAFDALETLSKFLVNDRVDEQLFDDHVGAIIREVSQTGRPIRAFGEMVSLLANRGDCASAWQLEQLWNALRARHEFSLFCAYSLRSFGSAGSSALTDICREHSRVIPGESYSALTSAEERLRAIVVLQQKARALESEITERLKAEEALRLVTDELNRLLISEPPTRAEAEQ